MYKTIAVQRQESRQLAATAIVLFCTMLAVTVHNWPKFTLKQRLLIPSLAYLMCQDAPNPNSPPRYDVNAWIEQTYSGMGGVRSGVTMSTKMIGTSDVMEITYSGRDRAAIEKFAQTLQSTVLSKVELQRQSELNGAVKFAKTRLNEETKITWSLGKQVAVAKLHHADAREIEAIQKEITLQDRTVTLLDKCVEDLVLRTHCGGEWVLALPADPHAVRNNPINDLFDRVRSRFQHVGAQ